MGSSVLLGGVCASGRAAVTTRLLLQMGEPGMDGKLVVLNVLALGVRYPQLDPLEPER
jgi:hypothetical protein